MSLCSTGLLAQRSLSGRRGRQRLHAAVAAFASEIGDEPLVRGVPPALPSPEVLSPVLWFLSFYGFYSQ